MTFRVGQKVVCVGSPVRVAGLGDILPMPGEIYTIRDIKAASAKSKLRGLAFRLMEIRNKPRPIAEGGLGESNFSQKYFRPLTERKTDISILKALLVPGSKIREDA